MCWLRVQLGDYVCRNRFWLGLPYQVCELDKLWAF